MRLFERDGVAILPCRWTSQSEIYTRNFFRSSKEEYLMDKTDMEALFDQGMCALKERDRAAAFKLFRRAAEGGHIEAQCNLGRMYLKG